MNRGDEPVTVVSGLPRSGTSMMMRMLEAGGMAVLADGVRPADEDNPGGYYELDAVKRSREDVSWVEHASGLAVKVIHRLLRHLPADRAYRVILMKRDVEEVVTSQEAMLRRRGHAGGTMSPAELVEVFEGEWRRAEAWLRSRRHVEILIADYNELVRDPGPTVQRVNEFLGGGLDTPAMRRVVRPELHRSRRPRPREGEGPVRRSPVDRPPAD